MTESIASSVNLPIEKAYIISNYIVVPTYIIHSEECHDFILYIISIDLHKHLPHALNECIDNRYVEIEWLKIFIHDSSYKSIRYEAKTGRGYRLPRIIHNGSTK